VTTLLAALTWEPQIKGGLYVLLAVTILCGSCYLLLATNMGARLGFQLAGAGLFGFLTTIGLLWWVYAIGPIGPSPSWHSEGIVTGDLSRSANPALEDFPSDWEKIEVSDPAVADALPVVDGQLVSAPGQRRMFANASEYVLVAAFEKGGESFGPFGIEFRPFDVFHKAHYLAIQVQRAGPPEPGRPTTPDPAAEPVSVIMIRDLGAERLNPAIFCLSSMAIFLLFCYQLHTRDRELAAAREAETRSPQPVLR
jgi:hypothetical protein